MRIVSAISGVCLDVSVLNVDWFVFRPTVCWHGAVRVANGFEIVEVVLLARLTYHEALTNKPVLRLCELTEFLLIGHTSTAVILEATKPWFDLSFLSVEHWWMHCTLPAEAIGCRKVLYNTWAVFVCVVYLVYPWECLSPCIQPSMSDMTQQVTFSTWLLTLAVPNTCCCRE